MDQNRFQEAQQAYDTGDYRAAAKAFLASAGRGPDGNGAAYHMAGNSLMRLRRHQDAVTVYGHALRDAVYEKRGAVWANLGGAYTAMGEYAEAAKSYQNAIAESDYTTPYKAYQGLAGALLERGHIEESAIAYRKAALDPDNPDPGKALVNLGLCFMALGRPSDAVDAYHAALGFDEYQGRGKALANLGQAYVALGEYDEAAKSFEKATQLHGHRLSAAAQEANATALSQLQPDEHEVIDGWLTGEIIPDDLPVAQPTGQWDTSEMFATTDLPMVQAQGVTAAASGSSEETAAHDALGFGDEASVVDFFSVTEEELKVRDREARRTERHERGPGFIWRRLAFVAVGAFIVVGLLIGAYSMGFGWPTQSQSVAGMLGAVQTGAAVDGFWVAVPSKDISKEMAKIPPVQSYTIDSVARSASTSTVAITVTPKTGAPLHYVITLSREGVGWKVTGVENDWRSTGG